MTSFTTPRPVECLLCSYHWNAEKALDRIHWKYLQHVLQKFEFRGQILNALLALYTTPSAQVFSADIISQPFAITNGTRQGCPLSPLIFNLLMEPLVEHIRQNPKITGFEIGHKTYKISLFADDVILMLTNPTSSLVKHEIPSTGSAESPIIK